MRNITLQFALPILIAVVYAPTLQAQDHEVSIYIGGGLATLNADMTPVFDISNTHKAGGTAGIGYVYNFSSLFALQTGVEATIYQSNYTLDEVDGNYIVNIPSGEKVKLEYILNGYHEKAKATYISIPIMARFKLPVGGKFNWSTAAGIKLGVAVNSKYENSYARLHTSGVVVEGGKLVDVEPLVNLPGYGFGTYNDGKDDGTLKLRMACMLAAETGISYQINKRYSVYTGVYGDYAINDAHKNKNRPFVEYNTAKPSEPVVNGMLNAINKRNLEAISLAKSMKPLAWGMKVQLTYHF